MIRPPIGNMSCLVVLKCNPPSSPQCWIISLPYFLCSWASLPSSQGRESMTDSHSTFVSIVDYPVHWKLTKIEARIYLSCICVTISLYRKFVIDINDGLSGSLRFNGSNTQNIWYTKIILHCNRHTKYILLKVKLYPEERKVTAAWIWITAAYIA